MGKKQVSESSLENLTPVASSNCGQMFLAKEFFTSAQAQLFLISMEFCPVKD